MDGLPGIIASDDEFGVNSAGMMITETTISRFHGWDPNGKPEFVRARKAMQYADSIDSFAKIIADGNNGGYANDWLLGDRKTGEIARFELGLKHTKLWRTTDGYFSGWIARATGCDPRRAFSPDNLSSFSERAARALGRIAHPEQGQNDPTLAEAFLADHYDTFTKKTGANLRTLCGHGESSMEGEPGWDVKPYDPSGAVLGKVIDTRMAEAMTFIARIGHPLRHGVQRSAVSRRPPGFFMAIPGAGRYGPAGPWTQFRIGEHALYSIPH